MLAIQTEVAQQIARSLAVELVPERQALVARSITSNTEAYELYLRGRHYLNQRVELGYSKAIDYFNRAIQKRIPATLPLMPVLPMPIA